jgi:hypothetical protein
MKSVIVGVGVKAAAPKQSRSIQKYFCTKIQMQRQAVARRKNSRAKSTTGTNSSQSSGFKDLKCYY